MDRDRPKLVRLPGADEGPGQASDVPTSWAEVDADALYRLAGDVVASAVAQPEDSESLSAMQRSMQSGFLPEALHAAQTPRGREVPVDPLGLVPLASVLQAASEADAAAAAQPRAVSRRATTGLEALELRLREQSAALRGLVRENFGRFIASRTTIDDVHARLERLESGAGATGAPSAAVLRAVEAVTASAARAFQPLHDRAQRAERIRVVLGLLDRYEACVELPGRLRAAAAAGARAQLAGEYRRAQALLEAVRGDEGGREGARRAWALLSAEVDAVAGEALARLLGLLRCEETTTPADALGAVAGALELRAAGVPAGARDAADAADPARVYVESQARRVEALLAGAARGGARGRGPRVGWAGRVWDARGACPAAPRAAIHAHVLLRHGGPGAGQGRGPAPETRRGADARGFGRGIARRRGRAGHRPGAGPAHVCLRLGAGL
ncbi:hypothetical protein QBZ16_000057 [Prototheca wickerhamii]|uniref:Exocyst complex component SEC5 n=1 Tax=Prototheca wickerhamii TaxID=3111 RepID=A0AAD9MIH9_PROWI|nr:hypothetical protein QBZ16_000057 [Prototheca wickerhamii]